MQFISTRNKNDKVSFSTALVKGLASDGGLYVPESYPLITDEEFESMLDMSYDERANLILGKFATDLTQDEIAKCTSSAYSLFDGDPAPVVKIDEGIYLLELFHGPTLAFKDMALTLFPRMLAIAREKAEVKEDVLILVATSGDTGKAALEGFADVDHTKIVVFYPSEGVALMQKLQMATQKGENVYVAAVKGNFDNCQTGVKEIFGNEDIKKEFLEKGIRFSSANSINLGRLLPQVVYYISAYLDLVASDEIEMGDEVNFSVPTGNFGDILAGIYAKKMGLPVNKFLCASNSNNVLTDFFTTGKYDANREFFKTISPSMDILVSSNLERYMFEATGRDDQKIKDYMKSLKETGEFEISKEELEFMTNDVYPQCATEEETYSTIGHFYDEYGYVLDPHTAVGVYVSDTYLVESGDYTPCITVSTASPYKFCPAVLKGVKARISENPFDNARTLRRVSAIDVPDAISTLETAELRFEEQFEVEQMADAIREFIK